MTQTAAFRKHALCRKPTGVERRTIPALSETELTFMLGKLTPDERKAMDWIVENADLIQVERRGWLLVPATPFLLDTLAAFGSEAEDRENDLEDEPGADDEPDVDDEPSIGEHAGVVDGEPQAGRAPQGSVKSLEAFRARGRSQPSKPWWRQRAEIQKLHDFLLRLGKRVRVTRVEPIVGDVVEGGAVVVYGERP